MENEEFKFKTGMIKKHFKDNRTIKCPTPKHLTRLDDDVHPGGEIFTTEDGDFIDLEIQFVDFDEEELAKYVEFAENLYEKHQKHVSVYLLCPKNINVTVKECSLKSEADFTIKLACSDFDLCHLTLNHIKYKLKHNITLDGFDIYMAEMLPVMCRKKDRKYFRVESLKILNQIN